MRASLDASAFSLFLYFIPLALCNEVSHNGLCGDGVSCFGSMWGNCCSSAGYCGATEAYCGTGCQLEYGYCDDTKGKISPDGTCGGGNDDEPTVAPTASPTACPEANNTIFTSDNCTNGTDTSTTIAIATPSNSAPAEISGSPTATPSSCAGDSSSDTNYTSYGYGAFASDGECTPCDGQGGSLPYCGADVATDNYKFTPKTCRIVYYNFDITNATISPDGISRIGLLVNGQLPGPTIEANWGDTIVVTVNNKMEANGTAIHFHGIRQLNNSEHDGVPSITQCPIAPGQSMTYRWVATNYGTSWYHSHYALQTWMGVYGPMVIHGPTSQGYDADGGTIMLSDWSHTTTDSMYDLAQDATLGGPRTMDNGLINGMNTWGVDGTTNQTGKRYELPVQFEQGQTYLFRIVNTAMQSTYMFYIDGHTMTVINMDFTAIQPYQTKVLSINIGQRYMVLVKADQPPGNYWMRADNQNQCGATLQATDIKGIVRYSGADANNVNPTSTANSYAAGCADEPLASLIPIAAATAADEDTEYIYSIDLKNNGQNFYKWYLSGTTFNSNFSDPTLLSVLDNDFDIPSYSGNLVLDLPDLNKWVYIVIESSVPLPHPMHLHGHDFFILAAGTGTWDAASTQLNVDNPPRRDTAMMPGAGYLVVAFQTDNPGVWLMHCHIGWHASMGFALQIVEGKGMLGDSMKNKCGADETCKGWDDWVAASGFGQHESGV
ncbi:hypothetical protein EJ04DRAFT_483935 [Polyplosphaeria fusca]|uniref:Chitin-binding type-1 domain-containing protein n=1 Tax=Polyplosphaeria fusca TaxID=682080 RepID=A0A9P4RA91_9PLEO|nr:hypothetical protein EJ04DRAFT_483935 [Polyplosphaeria fusca]